MDKFYVVPTAKAKVDADLALMRKSSLLMLQELAKESPSNYYEISSGTSYPAIYCTGVWVNQAIQSILTKEHVGKKLRYLALRNDGRILEVEFTAVVAPDRLKTRIV